MSHFLAGVRGSRAKVTRPGTKKSGVLLYCACPSGAVRCKAYVNASGVACVSVELIRAGSDQIVYDGPIGGPQAETCPHCHDKGWIQAGGEVEECPYCGGLNDAARVDTALREFERDIGIKVKVCPACNLPVTVCVCLLVD